MFENDVRPVPVDQVATRFGWSLPRVFAMPLVERFGMDEVRRRQRQTFLGISQDDAANLHALKPVFAAHAREFAERFYQHLLADPTTAAFLRDPQQLEQLKTKQAEYFGQLLEGVFDRAYFETRLRVGLSHQRVGLGPVSYLVAYNQYVQLTFPLFVRAFGDDLAQVLPSLLSLVKVIFLDIGLALDTYFQEATGRIHQRNEELQQALELYWQAQRREEQLRRLASHEVRGNLAAVITLLEDVLDRTCGQLDEAATGQLEQASRRCWSLSNLLKDMLTAADRAGGPGWVELGPVFEALAARFGLYAEGRSVRLNLPDRAPRVWADPVQLREVFANLIANAVRYLDKEPGLVTVSCREDGGSCVFGVADNGPGIPAGVHDRIFEPFVRGSQGPGHHASTGLGLYFVRTLIEQGGGKVWVENSPGAGTCFYFTVPRQPPGPAGGPDHDRRTNPDRQEEPDVPTDPADSAADRR